MAVTQNSRYIRRPGLWQENQDGLVRIYDDREAEVVGFDGVAGFIWNALGPGMTVADIVADLGRVFMAQEKTLTRDTQEFLTRLRNLGLVEEYHPSRVDEILEEVYACVPRMTCGGCGDCCTSVVIYSAEFECLSRWVESRMPCEDRARMRASALLNAATRRQQERHMAEEGIEAMIPLEKCIFYDDSRSVCRVYDLRPFACRVYGLEQDRPCERGAIGVLDRGVSVDHLRQRLPLLRRDLDSVSGFYFCEGRGRPFNAAALNSWFLCREQLNRKEPFYEP